MIARATKSKRTWQQVLDQLKPLDSDRPLFRRYYYTLRRRGLGQTSAFIGAWMALECSQAQISSALGGSLRCVAENWSGIKRRFGLRGMPDLMRFLLDPHAWPHAERSKPTPQERPCVRATTPWMERHCAVAQAANTPRAGVGKRARPGAARKGGKGEGACPRQCCSAAVADHLGRHPADGRRLPERLCQDGLNLNPSPLTELRNRGPQVA